MPTTTEYAACTDCCGGSQQTNCCPDPLPANLTGTVSAPTCPAIDGVVVPMAYDPVGPKWEGSVVVGGVTITVRQADATLMGSPYCPISMDCDGDPVILSGSSGDLVCTPAFSHSVTGTVDNVCGCSGSHSVTIYVTE